jgi:hypothetical protein
MSMFGYGKDTTIGEIKCPKCGASMEKTGEMDVRIMISIASPEMLKAMEIQCWNCGTRTTAAELASGKKPRQQLSGFRKLAIVLGGGLILLILFVLVAVIINPTKNTSPNEPSVLVAMIPLGLLGAIFLYCGYTGKGLS